MTNTLVVVLWVFTYSSFVCLWGGGEIKENMKENGPFAPLKSQKVPTVGGGGGVHARRALCALSVHPKKMDT